MTVSAVIADASTQKVRNIYAALCGSGTLVISTSPQERISISDVRLPVPEAKALLVAELPITFVCEPFAESTEQSTADITTATSTPARVDNDGTQYVDPEITIVPSAARTDINCNGKVIFVTTPTSIVAAGYPANAKIVLDCDAQLAYYQIGDGDKTACTQNTQGPFPRLNVGENYFLTTAAQSVVMRYRERWL
jgi:phage-related protein